MFAIVEIAGFQEKIEQGAKMRIPLADVEAGKTITFDKVLLFSDGETVTVGTPHVAGVSVEVKVIGHGKTDKIRVVKMRRRKRYRRVHGHRQDYTDVEVMKISK